MPKILVTGGAGYIGSHTCKLLARSGYDPVVFDDLSTGTKEFVRFGAFVHGSLSDTRLLSATLRATQASAVVHFAASAYVGESMGDPQKYFRNNVAGTINLLDAMRDTGVSRIVFSSTCATYGTPAVTPIREDAPQRPVNPYGESKLFVERMLQWSGPAWGLQFAILRYFNAAGADAEGELGENHDPEPHLIPAAITAALGRRPPLEVFGTDYATPDGTAIRDYTHVEDLAAAHVAALQYLDAGGVSDAFNLGSGKGASVRDVLACIEAVAGKPVPAEEKPRRPGDPPVLVADPAKAATALGWQPRRSSLRSIVETAWRWHASRSSGHSQQNA